MRRLLIIVVLLFSINGFSQVVEQPVKDSERLIQLTGIVITDSLYRVPYTRVFDRSTKRGAIADYFGYFALVVHPGDTVEFSCLGFSKKVYVVPEDTEQNSISLVQMMNYKDIMGEPVDVYPWPSREEFADAFVNMDLPNDIMNARQRLSPQEMAFVGALLSADGGSAYSAYRVQQSQAFYTRGQGPQNNFLNPAAWSEFLKGFGTGKYQISQ
jgi:hypothetical protein